ncbi:hypothetical protein SteCoe_11030 [Stentor coeruleus]|uniref:Uncharacterized protein n=1 Tax=Stentor coeruleus TaxID=5963 RepID=A0A1R2CE39_9CILI|nr:hypothetical protein SteCoe_11030 [Stentor coeruleus]
MSGVPLLNQSPQPISPSDAINSFISKLEEGLKPSFEFSGHKNPIRALSLSSDFLATGSADKSISIWSISEKRLLANLTGHQNWVISLGFTKDNKYLISGSGDGTLKYWDLENYQEVLSFKAHSGTIACLAVSNYYVFTGSSDKTAKLWIRNSENEEFTFVGHTEPVYCLVVSEDEKFLYTGSRDYTIKVWNIDHRVLECTFNGHSHWVYCLSLSANGKFLVSGSEDKTVRIWSLLERAEKFVYRGHLHTITSVAVTSDDKYIISGSDSVIKVWSVEDQHELFTTRTHKGFVRCVASTLDRKYIVSAGDDNLVKFWDISDILAKNQFLGHTAAISTLDSNTKYVVSGSEDKTWKLWNISGELLHTYQGHKDRIFCVQISFDSQFIASSSADRTIKVYNIVNKSDLTLTGYDGWIRCILWRNDLSNTSNNSDFIYSGCDDYTIYITSISKKDIVGKLVGHQNAVYCLSLSKDSKTLYSGSADRSIIAWDLNLNSIIYIFEGHRDNVTGLCLNSTDSNLISASSDCSVKVWNLFLRREEFSFNAHEKPITSLCLNSETGLIFTSSEDFSIKSWNIIEKREEYSILTSNSISCLTTIGNSIIGGSKDKIISLWDIEDYKGLNLKAHPYQSNFDFTSAVCNYAITLQSLNSSQASLPFGNDLFTLVHIFAHQGDEDKLSKVLNSGPRIRTDRFGRSPIYYSIKKQSQPCTDMLLKYLISISEDSQRYLNETYALRSDLIELIYNSSAVLPEFLSSLLIIQSKCFAQPSEALAIVRRSCLQKVYIDDFTVTKTEVPIEQKANLEILLQFQTTGFKLPEVLGSIESLKMLKALLDSRNKKIFESTLVQYYVRSKWNNLWTCAFIYTLLIWFNLILILVFTTDILFDFWLKITFVIINILLISVEIVQLANSSISEYFTSFWNWVDLIRFILSIAWLWLKWENLVFSVLTWFMIFVNFMKGVTGFRAFDKTRFYVRLFFRSFKDISYFLLIFFYSTVGFGLLFASNKVLTTDQLIRYIWLSPFDLNLGNFESNESLSLDYLGFFIASIVNVIVLLSLLISILGDSFDRFRLEAVEIDHIEMAELVYDLELLLFWRNNSNFSSYMQICDTTRMSYQIDEWEGSAKAIEMNISKSFDRRLKIVETEIRNNHGVLSGNIQTLESIMAKNNESLEKKINNLEKKLNQLLEAVSK